MSTKNSTVIPLPEDIISKCDDFGFFLLPEQAEKLCCYLRLLLKWNKVMNLVGFSDWESILLLLFFDSLYLADFLRELECSGFIRPVHETSICWDLGAGAGLPGIPLRVLWEKGQYTLVEAREKRAIFLQTTLAACPLKRTAVFRGRADQFMEAQVKAVEQDGADIIVSRAFMPWEKVLELVQPYTKPGGIVIFLTLQTPEEQQSDAWALVDYKEYDIPAHKNFDATKRYFWALAKN